MLDHSDRGQRKSSLTDESHILMRYPTWIESLTLLAICAVFCGLMLPTSHEMRKREFRNIAKNWKPSIETAIADQKLLNVEVDLDGLWWRGSPRGGSDIEITQMDDPTMYRVRFYSRSGGGCEWQTTAQREDARLTLADPVADIWDNAFNTFWIVRVDERDCLVPVPSAAKFNAAIADFDNDWHYNVFTRGPR
jgi:hypothetical protein